MKRLIRESMATFNLTPHAASRPKERSTMLNKGSAQGEPVFFIRIGFVFLLFLLIGCATTYHPENLTGGYTDFRQTDTTYRVRFKGNNYTSHDKVEQFLLYRCAELTTQLGYDHFLLLSQDVLDISDPLARVGIFPHNYYATALIQVVHQSENAAGYDAKEVMRKLQAQYPKELGS